MSAATPTGEVACSLVTADGRERLLVPSNVGSFDGAETQDGLLCELTAKNGAALRKAWPVLAPRPLGLRASFGFGDRLGCATRGHVAALRRSKSALAPMLAQQSAREVTRTQRSFQEVLDAATWGVLRTGWLHGYGADADHLQTVQSVLDAAQAGFTTFTLDPSAHVVRGAAALPANELTNRFRSLPWERLEDDPDAALGRLRRGFEHASGRIRPRDDREAMAAMVKYGVAIVEAAQLAGAVPAAAEVELSLDEAAEVTTPLEHAAVVGALRRLGVTLIALAPRFPGAFEKGIEYRGSVPELTRAVEAHAALAVALGPYKLSLHSGSDKFTVYTAFARASAGHFHVKTAGTSYLEALRLVAATDPELMRELWLVAREVFPDAKRSYELTASLDESPPAELPDESLPGLLDDDTARRLLHVSFGQVVGNPGLRARLDRVLTVDDGKAYADLLERHLAAHLALLR